MEKSGHLYQKLLNKVTGYRNFIDKYLPIQVHRELTNYLKFVVSNNNEQLSRLHWYDEIKTPLLTSLILVDAGTESLD